MEDIYCQLIPNEDKEVQCYDMIPRIGAMEVSYKGIIIFSKMMSSVWPNYESVSKFVAEMLDDVSAGMSAQELRKKYQTTGKVVVAVQSVRKSTVASMASTASSGDDGLKQAVQELKSLTNAPAEIKTCVIGVLQILGEKKKMDWIYCQKQMANPAVFC